LVVFYCDLLFGGVDSVDIRFKVLSQLIDFFGDLHKVFGVQIAIRSDSLVDIKLLFKAGFLLNVLFLEFRDQIVF
jgi:hypothetical protein